MKLDGLAVRSRADDALDPGRVEQINRDMSFEELRACIRHAFATSLWTVTLPLNLRTPCRIVATWQAVESCNA